MIIDSKEIERTTNLAHLTVSDAEKGEYAKQLSDIISYVEKINELDTSSILPTDHIVELANVFRHDDIHPSIDRAELERVAPQFGNGHVIVPKIIEGEA